MQWKQFGPKLRPVRVLASILCLMSSTAVAGDWKAVGSTTKGHTVCGLSSIAEGRRFELHYVSGANSFAVEIGRADWHLKGDTHEAMLRFDGHAPWTVTLTKGVFSLPVESLGRFITEFRDSNTFTVLVRVAPPTGWAASLSGSGAAGDDFLQCSRELL